MNFQNWRRGAFILVFLGASIYIVLTLVAMLVYTGGTYTNPDASGYSFLNNFFSDLGRTVAHSGEANTIAWILFTASVLTIGIAMILFYSAWISLFQDDASTYRLSQVGSIFGIIAAIGFIGVGLTPWDLLLEPHFLSVRIGFFFTFIASTIYSFVLYRQTTYPRVYLNTLLTFTGISFLYLILLFFGPAAETTEGLFIQVVGQKIIVYIMAVVFSIQGYGALKVSTST
ncbi:hypothetical protein CEE45_13755 [Candidatus Heimdallarchaeota archaeon B3_Heim]|nr:MAG: hypothetical protein CEE45_13755 [Candidatus Heimdallarchaeota archaeon B3_Heim]